MAGSSKKASPKSLKGKQKGKAAAPETEPASTSPRRTRQTKVVAPETESASKSLKRTRQSMVVAPETEPASKSPKRTQQSKATMSETGSGNFNNEDYNIRSPERTKLLTKIKGVINNAPVSPALWACCQLADMKSLQAVVKAPRRMILGYQKSLAFIVLQCELLGF
jgi:hypothetical protein